MTTSAKTTSSTTVIVLLGLQGVRDQSYYGPYGIPADAAVVLVGVCLEGPVACDACGVVGGDEVPGFRYVFVVGSLKGACKGSESAGCFEFCDEVEGVFPE